MTTKMNAPKKFLKAVLAFGILFWAVDPIVAQQQYTFQDSSPSRLTYDQPVPTNLSDAPVVSYVDPQQSAVQTQQPYPAVAPIDYGTPIASSPATCNCPECAAAKAKAAPAPKGNPCAKSHKPVFYDNDFSYLKDGGKRCFGDSLKGIKIGQGYLDIGGQVRYRYHHERGLGQQAGATRFQDTVNDFGLTRVRLYANWQVNDRIRLYAEGIHAAVVGANDEYIPRGIDRNFGDLLNLFADVKVFDRTNIRIGRQELLFGAQRFVSPLDWSNTRRRFDGIRSTTKFDKWTVDGFYTQLVPVVFNSFDNPNQDINFFGVYGTYKGFENATLETYYLGLDNEGVQTRDTFGARLQGSTANKWLYEIEAATQGGQFESGQDIAAHAYTVGLGRKFENLAWKPTLWGFYDHATGNDSQQGDFNGFNELFPLGHKYLGFIDAVQRTNIQSPNVRLSMTPTKRLSLLLWYYRFFSEEADANVLAFGGTPNQDLTTDDFGNELDFVATYKVSARSNLLLGYSHLWRGDKILEDNDADFFYLQWTTNF